MYASGAIDEDIRRKLALRDRVMRREAMSLTPEERMRRFWALQEEAFALLESNPEAWDRFYRRNLKKRAIPYDPDKAK